jgi:hypothetical protein
MINPPDYTIYFVAPFLLLLADKWGIIDWYEMHKPTWIKDICYLCFCFWVTLLLSLLLEHSLITLLANAITGSVIGQLILKMIKES